METVFAIFAAYWIVIDNLPEPTVCWREVRTEEGAIGANVVCTEEELKTLEIGND